MRGQDRGGAIGFGGANTVVGPSGDVVAGGGGGGGNGSSRNFPSLTEADRAAIVKARELASRDFFNDKAMSMGATLDEMQFWLARLADLAERLAGARPDDKGGEPS